VFFFSNKASLLAATYMATASVLQMLFLEPIPSTVDTSERIFRKL